MSLSLLEQGLDFETLSLEDLQAQAISSAAGLLIKLERTRADGLYLGAMLNAIKGRMKHGDWEDWVRDSFPLGVHQARRLMVSDRNRARVLDLPAEMSFTEVVEVVKAEQREERQAARREDLVARGEAVELVSPEPAFELTISEGDCAQIYLSDRAVDLLVTSPPYNLGKAYGGSDDRLVYEHEYMPLVSTWANEMARVLAIGGRLAIVLPLDTFDEGADRHRAVYADWVLELQNAGLTYQHSIVWNEGTITRSTARGSVDSPSAVHVIARVEMIAVFSRGSWNQHRDSLPHNLSHGQWLEWTNGVWTIPGERQDLHPAAFPEALADRLVRLYSFRGDTVLDPFLGSGTTALAAVKLGRNVIGYDLDPEMVALARGRLAAYPHAT
jgi:site-specific DNA-methyltransferase (adenine-specific)